MTGFVLLAVNQKNIHFKIEAVPMQTSFILKFCENGYCNNCIDTLLGLPIYEFHVLYTSAFVKLKQDSPF
jgi:hypothetical protein